MKKNVLWLCLLFSAIGFAQSFPGKDVALLKGKEVKVLALNAASAGLGYKGFYNDPEIKSVYRKGLRYTDKAALEGKVFKVVSYEPRYTNYVLKLENAETGTIYYDYHSATQEDFVFDVVGGISYPEGYFCKAISVTKKWVKATREYVDEVHMPVTNDICLYRTPDDVFKLRIGLTVDMLKKKELKGVTLYLENGEKLSFPDAVINIMQCGGKYTLTTRPRLRIDTDMLKKLQASKIVRKEIGSYSGDVANGDLIMEYIQCLAK